MRLFFSLYLTFSLHPSPPSSSIRPFRSSRVPSGPQPYLNNGFSKSRFRRDRRGCADHVCIEHCISHIYITPPLSLLLKFSTRSFLSLSSFLSFFLLSTRNIEDISAIRVIIIGFVIHAFLVLVSRVKEDERTPGSERGKEGRKEGTLVGGWSGRAAFPVRTFLGPSSID